MDSTTVSRKTLLDYLATVPDFRRAEGKRYQLSALLVMSIMAIMSRCFGYREIARFLKANQSALVETFQLKRNKMPSHVTIRTVLKNLDFKSVSAVFSQWVTDCHPVKPESWVSIDAKALASTIVSYDSAYQDFVSFVSAFAQQENIVIAVQRFQNKESSEIEVARELIRVLTEVLGLTGVTFTLDALHCQKNVTANPPKW